MSQAVPNENDPSLYDFDLPSDLIAQAPVTPRDSSRLLVLHRARGVWEHRLFCDLPDLLNSNDLMIANNTRVLKARLLGRRVDGASAVGGRVEFVLLEKNAHFPGHAWEGLFRASARAVPGFRFDVPLLGGGSLRGTVVRGASQATGGTVLAEFDRDPLTSGAGELPIPPYLGRKISAEDEENYQTVYARELGSAAAPTAGLHFTQKTRDDLKARGVNWLELTLHIGLGTFRPVKCNDVREHVMHEEKYEISPDVAASVNAWKARGGRVLAVGTTSVRALESSWQQGPGELEGHVQSGLGKTSLFIRPGIGFQFRVVDRLLTNFHLPRSTLLMMISTLVGRELILAAYHDAIQQGYRFFSYGDAMLILE